MVPSVAVTVCFGLYYSTSIYSVQSNNYTTLHGRNGMTVGTAAGLKDEVHQEIRRPAMV